MSLDLPAALLRAQDDIMLPYLACMIAVATYDHLPPRVLPSIQAVEGGSVGTVHPNANGSEDLGIMQINTVWVQPLARFTAMPVSVVRDRLVNDACFNIAAAGAILRANMDATGGNLMQSIGNYHSRTVPLNRNYQLLVMRAASLMFGSSR